MRRFFMLGLLIAAGATGPRAEEKSGDWLNPQHLDDTIVVTANRLATPVRRTAGSITVITAEQIRRSQAASVTEVLRSVPGLAVVQSGGPGQQAAIFMRGTNSEHVQMLIDGVKINDPSSPSNAVNLATLSLDNIERIEILRGPQSVLYGSDAMGGVIQVFTRTGIGKPRVGLALEGGSLDSHAERLSLRAGSETHDYSVELSRRSTGGVSAASGEGELEDDGFDNTTASASFGIRPSSRLELRLSGRVSDSDTDLDQGSGVLDDPNYTMSSKEQFVSARLAHDFVPGRLQQRFGAYVTHYERSTVDATDPAHAQDTNATHYDGRRWKYDWQLAAAVAPAIRAVAGVEMESDTLDQDQFFGSMWGDYVGAIEKVAARTSAGFLMGELGWRALDLTAGGRWDDHEKFGGHGTYRITGSLLVNRVGLKLKATFGSGFKAPSLFDIYDPSTGNPELEPEQSRGGEIGIETLFKSPVSGGVTYFKTHFDNLIQYQITNPLTYEGTMANVARARMKGIEAYLRFQGRTTQMTLDYAYTQARDAGTDLDLVRRPRHKVTLRADYRVSDAFYLGGDAAYTGSREDIGGPTGRVSLDDYTLVSLFASYALRENLRLSARVGNLTDAKYEEVYAMSALPRTISLGLATEF